MPIRRSFYPVVVRIGWQTGVPNGSGGQLLMQLRKIISIWFRQIYFSDNQTEFWKALFISASILIRREYQIKYNIEQS